MDPPGDRQQWVLGLVATHEQALLRYATRLLGDADRACDAVQHAFVELCAQSPAALDGKAVPWLYRVCRNRAIDLLRQAGRERGLDEVHPEAGPMRTTAEPVAREADPATRVESADLVGHLRGLIAKLPRLQAETLDLWSAGLSYREIATVTGKTEGHVRVLAHRGLAALRAHPLVRDLLASSTAVSPATVEVHR